MNTKQFRFVVAPEDAGQRLDRYLSAREIFLTEAVSRTRLKNLIESGHVTANGAPAMQCAAKIAADAEIAVAIPAPTPASPSPQTIALDVVYEDDHLLVLNKPAGLVVHPAAGHADGTLVNALIAHCGASLSGIGGVLRPGIVHRLDKDTSGLMVVAKNDAAHRHLSGQFSEHGRRRPFARSYTAFIWGEPDRKSGRIAAPLARHPHMREKITVFAGGKEAITHWRLEETFGSDRRGLPVASKATCDLETGRTHQIRVHMAHIGHPLIGDSVYGAGFKTKAAQLPPAAAMAAANLGRQALHARRLGFIHPVTGEFIDHSSELPDDLKNFERVLREP